MSGKSNIYNVGGEGEQVTIFDLAKKIADVYDAEVSCGAKNSEATIAAPNCVALDISRYNKEFGAIKNTVNLDQGILKLGMWLNSNE